jgi:prepilin-type N-terminal cleavage/methylation domain-containing protein
MVAKDVIRSPRVAGISSHDRQGFTLIELSVVLVIIGLIVGGVLVGRDLIEAASIRATVSQYEKYKSAVNAFQLKYNYLPGDLDTTGATAFGFSPTTRSGSFHADGNIGANNVWPDGPYPNAVVNYEAGLFWQDLSSANLIDGSFTSVVDGLNYNVTTAGIGSFVPVSKLNSSTYWFVYGRGILINNWLSNSPLGNYFQLMGITSASYAHIYPKNTLTPLEAYNIDTKIDDGIFDKGIVRAGEEIDSPNFFTSSVCTWLPNGVANSCGNPNLCFSAATSNYNIGGAPDTPACQLSFMAGF